MTTHSYKQESKNKVRERILTKAVRILSKDRRLAPIVQNDELRITVEAFVNKAKRFVPMNGWLAPATTSVLSDWIEFHNKSVGSREAGSLKVLYLCGAEPLNDLNVLMQEGINPHNVWALTSDKKDHQAAIKQCADVSVPLKIHRGGLTEFFSSVNESFDIIYFDACGPFVGGSPNTIDPIISIFERERLNSPGILITNFCEPPDEKDKKARDRYVKLMSAFFATRYNDLPVVIHSDGPDPAIFSGEPKLLTAFAANHVEQLYSEFVTRLISDLGMSFLPNCRALAMTSLFRDFMSSEYANAGKKSNAKLADAPPSYPLPAFVRSVEELLENDSIIKRLERPLNSQKRSLRALIGASALLDRVFEGHWDALSNEMVAAVKTSWFDLDLRITCDAPLPNLIVNSLLGTYGRPCFANPRHSDRVTYTAKTRTMYCDLFVMDQCRPYFDWFPTVHALPQRFDSVPFQIVARCILDRIERHNRNASTQPFRGSAVLGHGEHKVAGWYNFQDRELVE